MRLDSGTTPQDGKDRAQAPAPNADPRLREQRWAITVLFSILSIPFFVFAAYSREMIARTHSNDNPRTLTLVFVGVGLFCLAFVALAWRLPAGAILRGPPAVSLGATGRRDRVALMRPPEQPIAWIVLVVGVLMLCFCVWVTPRTLAELRSRRHMFTQAEEARCTLVGKRVVTELEHRRFGSRPELTLHAPGGEPVAGFAGYPERLYGALEAEAIIAPYEVGRTYPCWIKAGHPESAIVTRLPRNLWFDWAFIGSAYLGAVTCLPFSLAALLLRRRRRGATLASPAGILLTPPGWIAKDLGAFSLAGVLGVAGLSPLISPALDGWAIKSASAWLFGLNAVVMTGLTLVGLVWIVRLFRSALALRHAAVEVFPAVPETGGDIRICLTWPADRKGAPVVRLEGSEIIRFGRGGMKRRPVSAPLTMEKQPGNTDAGDVLVWQGTIPAPALPSAPFRSITLRWQVVIQPPGWGLRFSFLIGWMTMFP